jgi:hypothetical protein
VHRGHRPAHEGPDLVADGDVLEAPGAAHGFLPPGVGSPCDTTPTDGEAVGLIG